MAAAVRVCLHFAIFFWLSRGFIDVYITEIRTGKSCPYPIFLGWGGLSRVPAGWCISLSAPRTLSISWLFRQFEPFLC